MAGEVIEAKYSRRQMTTAANGCYSRAITKALLMILVPSLINKTFINGGW